MRSAGGLAALAMLAAAVTPAAVADPDPVVIAILDSGILTTHTQFSAGQVVAWKDWINARATPYDDQGHGTAVASRAAGATLGAYPGAHLIIGKVLDSGNHLRSWLHVRDGIKWAVNQGADVVSISIWSLATGVSPTSSRAIEEAVDYAVDRGVLVVWIAGNGGYIYPGGNPVPNPVTSAFLVGSSSPQVLVVGASDEAGSRASFSQRDPELLAWGESVPIAWNDGFTYCCGAGTSFAAPWVAGAAARLLADGAPRDPGWLEWVILHCAVDNPAVHYLDEGYGFFGSAGLACARAIAQGSSPVPGPDARDAFHAAMTVPRLAQNAHASSGVPGVLPPS